MATHPNYSPVSVPAPEIQLVTLLFQFQNKFKLTLCKAIIVVTQGGYSDSRVSYQVSYSGTVAVHFSKKCLP